MPTGEDGLTVVCAGAARPLMAEYSERTGAVIWQRVMLASQREIVEKWLREQYPVQAPELKRSLSDQARPYGPLDVIRSTAGQLLSV